MKKLIVILMFVCTFLFSGIAYADLIAYYQFNSNASDTSGYGNHGTVYGTSLTADRFGNANSAYSFDGVDDYVEVPNDSSLNVNGDSITLSAWIKTSMTPSWSGHIISKGIDWHWQYRISITPDGRVDAIAHYAAGGHYLSPESSILVNDDQWHHIVGVLTDDGAYIYVDGILRGTDTTTEYPWNKVDEYPLVIGRMSREPYNPPTNYFSGLLDDISLYNHALSVSCVTLF